jgi:hypothetical protein
MKLVFLVTFAAVLFAGPAVHSNRSTAASQGANFIQILESSRSARVHDSSDPSSQASGECCKICTRGKACGNTCISRDDICRVGPGCACDG